MRHQNPGAIALTADMQTTALGSGCSGGKPSGLVLNNGTVAFNTVRDASFDTADRRPNDVRTASHHPVTAVGTPVTCTATQPFDRISVADFGEVGDGLESYGAIRTNGNMLTIGNYVEKVSLSDAIENQSTLTFNNVVRGGWGFQP